MAVSATEGELTKPQTIEFNRKVPLPHRGANLYNIVSAQYLVSIEIPETCTALKLFSEMDTAAFPLGSLFI